MARSRRRQSGRGARDRVAATGLQRHRRLPGSARGDTVRHPRLAIILATASLAGGCSKPAPAPPPPAEVYVAAVVQQDVPIYLELVGQTTGFQDVEIRARVEGLSRDDELPRGLVRPRRATLLYQIDRKPLEAVARRARRPTRRRAAGDGSRRPTTMSRATRRSSRSRRSASRSWTTRALGAGRRRAVAGRGRQGGGREGDARSRLHARHVADQRAGRHDAGQAGQSRRTRREHAADDDLADRSDDLPRRRHRGRLPAHRQARSRDGRRRRRARRASS